MDSSSYTNHDAWRQSHTRSPLSPVTPSSAIIYRANINRQKTKKWVEAKPQSYDGDDWGQDLDEDDQPPSQLTESRQQQIPSKTSYPASLPPTKTTLSQQGISPNQECKSSPQSDIMKPQSGTPALHIQTQQPFDSVSNQHRVLEQISSTHSNISAGSIDLNGFPGPVLPSGSSSVYSHSETGFTPASLSHSSPIATQSGPTPQRNPMRMSSSGRYEKPVDMYRRIGEEIERERLAESPQPSIDSPVATRTSERSDLSMNKAFQNTAASHEAEALHVAPVSSTHSIIPSSGNDSEQGRNCTGPQLPSVARVSVFGVDDIFSGYRQNRKNAPAMPPIPSSHVSSATTESQRDHQLHPVHATEPAPILVAQPSSSRGSEADALNPAGFERNQTHLQDGLNTSARSYSNPPNEPKVIPVQQAATPEPESATSTDATEGTEPPPSHLVVNTEVMNRAAAIKKRASMMEVSPVSDSDDDNKHSNKLPTTRNGDQKAKELLPPLHTSSSSALPGQSKGSKSANSQPISNDTTHITPIAPLNPQRSDRPPEEFIAPAIFQAEGTMSTTTSLSPVKESDRLREEIMHSLSPVAASTGNPDFVVPRTGGNISSPGAADEIPQNALRESHVQTDGPHKRFSWEDDGSEESKVNQKDEGFGKNDLPFIAHPNDDIQAMRTIQGQSDTTEKNIPPANSIGPVQHQVSQVNDTDRKGPDSCTLEPPLQISVATDRVVDEQTGRSFSEKGLAPATPLPPKSQTQQSAEPTDALLESKDGKPAGSVTPVAVKLLTFREILSIPSSTERYKKYDETRVQFQQMDSGLSEFLRSLKMSHPDLENCNGQFSASIPKIGTVDVDATGRHHLHGQPSVQQPHYQHLAATNAALPGASPAGYTPPSSTLSGSGAAQAAHGDVRHPHNQIGHMSKELFAKASGVGKGLLHKGRNKLRGSGEKVPQSAEQVSTASSSSSSYGYHGPPPPSQLNKKGERRSSWGLSLGGRTRGESGSVTQQPQTLGQQSPQPPQPHPSLRTQPLVQQEMLTGPTPSSPLVPQLSGISQVFPFNSISQGGQSPVKLSGREASNFRLEESVTRQPHFYAPPRPQFAGPSAVTQSELVSSVSDTHLNPASTLADEPLASSSMSAPEKQGLEPDSQQKLQSSPIISSTSVSSPIQQIHGTPASQGPPNQAPTLTDSNKVTEDDRLEEKAAVSPKSVLSKLNTGSVHTQTTSQNVPGRHPSFVGLPPIRRGSTFGLPIGKLGKGGDGKIDESSSPIILENPTVSSPVTISESETAEEIAQLTQDQQAPDASHIDASSSTITERGLIRSQSLQSAEQQKISQLPTIKQDIPLSLQQTNETTAAAQAPPQQQPPHNPVERLQPGVATRDISGSVSLPKLPPGWKVEESHLSEPLLPSSRKRASSHASEDEEPEDYSIDKEMEAGFSLSSQPLRDPRPILEQHNRPANALLHSPTQKNHPGKINLSNEPHSGKPEIEGISSMRPRAISSSGLQNQQLDPNSPLMGNDNGRRRHSGLPFLGKSVSSMTSRGPLGNDSMQLRTREIISTHEQQPQTSQFAPPEKKRTFFSGVSQPKSPKPGVLSRSSTSNSMTIEGTPPKKRFSGLSNMLKKQGSSAKHDLAQTSSKGSITGHSSLQSEISSSFQPPLQNQLSSGIRNSSVQSQQSIGFQGSLGLEDRRSPTVACDRSNTVDLDSPAILDLTNPDPDDLRRQDEEQRGRRVSGPSFLSNLFNHRSSSKPRDAKMQQSLQSQQIYMVPGSPIPPHPQGPRLLPQGLGTQMGKNGPMQPPGPGAQGLKMSMAKFGTPRFQQQPQQSSSHSPQQQLPPVSLQPTVQGGFHKESQLGSFPSSQRPLTVPTQSGQDMVVEHQLVPSKHLQWTEDQQSIERPRSEINLVAPISSPSPLSQRSQPLASPPLSDWPNQTDTFQAEGNAGVKDRTSSFTSYRSGKHAVERAPVEQQSRTSHSSPATQWPTSSRHMSPQSQNQASFTQHIDSNRGSTQSIMHETSGTSPSPGISLAPSSDMRRTSTPSFAYSLQTTENAAAQATVSSQIFPGSQSQRLSGHGIPDSHRNEESMAELKRRMSDSPQPHSPWPPSVSPPNNQISKQSLPRTDTQISQVYGFSGLPRPPFVVPQQSFASNHSTASQESHGKSKLFGGLKKYDKSDKQPEKKSFLSSFKKPFKQPEDAQQPQVQVLGGMITSPGTPQQKYPGSNGSMLYNGPALMQEQLSINMRHQAQEQQGFVSVQPALSQMPTGPTLSPMKSPNHFMNQPSSRQTGLPQQKLHVPIASLSQEPQYESVPIPAAYRPVHSDDMVVQQHPQYGMSGYFNPPQGWIPQEAIPGTMSNRGEVINSLQSPLKIQQNKPEIAIRDEAAIPTVTQHMPAPASSSRLNGQSFPDNVLRMKCQPINSTHTSSIGHENRQHGQQHDMSQDMTLRSHRSSNQLEVSIGSRSKNDSPLPILKSSSIHEDSGSTYQLVPKSSPILARSTEEASMPLPSTQDSMIQSRNIVAAERAITSEPRDQEPKAQGFTIESKPDVKELIQRSDSNIPKPTLVPAALSKSGSSLSSTSESRNEIVNVSSPSHSNHPKATVSRDAEEKQVAIDMHDQSEKIPVESDQNARQCDEDTPTMSATSYPGQEWNPYGNFEDWND